MQLQSDDGKQCRGTVGLLQWKYHSNTRTHTHIYIYICVCVCVCVHIYIYIYIIFINVLKQLYSQMWQLLFSSRECDALAWPHYVWPFAGNGLIASAQCLARCRAQAIAASSSWLPQSAVWNMADGRAWPTAATACSAEQWYATVHEASWPGSLALFLLSLCIGWLFLFDVSSDLLPSDWTICCQARVLSRGGDLRFAQVDALLSVSLSAFDRIAGLYNRHLDYNRKIFLR
jgi:hypothetical protein